jgi:hypothetical protein
MTHAVDSMEIQPVNVETQYAVLTVHCTCGDTTSVTLSGFDESQAPCPCGRTWQLRVTVEPDPISYAPSSCGE